MSHSQSEKLKQAIILKIFLYREQEEILQIKWDPRLFKESHRTLQPVQTPITSHLKAGRGRMVMGGRDWMTYLH